MADTKISGLSAVTSVLSTDEFVLARSGTTKKIGAADLSAGLGGGAMVLISNVTLSSAGNIDMTSIPGTYNHLRLVVWGRSNLAAVTNDNVKITLNNDTGANYDWQFWQDYGATGGQAEGIADTSWALASSMPAAGSPSGAASSLVLDLPFYADTTFRKTGIVTSSVALFDTSQGQRLWHSTGEWRSTAAITRVTVTTVSGQFVVGTRATLHGIT